MHYTISKDSYHPPSLISEIQVRNHIKQEPNPADQVLFSKLCIAAQQMSPLFFPKSPLMRYNLECFHCRICEVNTFVQLKLCISGFPTEDAYKAKKDHAEPLVPPGRVQCIEAAAKQNSAAHANYEGVGGLLGDRNLESTIWKGGPQKSQKQNYQCPIWTLWHTLEEIQVIRCSPIQVSVDWQAQGILQSCFYIVHAVDQNLDWPGMAS